MARAIDRRTIDEIIARYTLEPTLEDIYVEGLFDKEVLDSALRNKSKSERVVYEIDTINVPPELLIAEGLTDGNKQRVIALARALSALSGNCSYLCLVDRDLDHWFGELENTPRLRWSLFCSMELHYFGAEIINDLVVIASKSKISNLHVFVTSLGNVLTDLYSLRLADRFLAWGMKWSDVSSCLSTAGDKVLLDMEAYITRLLMANSRIKEREAFEADVKRWRAKLKGDYRMNIRGHDFIVILAWSIKKFRGLKEFASEDALQRLLILLAKNIDTIPTEVSVEG